MKRLSYFLMVILMALVSLGFAACSDDDEPKVADIVGTWQYDNPDETANYDMFYQFTKDGEFHVVEKYHEVYYGRPNLFVHHGTYTVSGTTLKFSLLLNDDEVWTTEGEYSVQGDKLKFLGGEEPTFTRVDDSVIEPYLQNS